MAALNDVQETSVVDLGTLLDAGDGAVVTLVAGETRLAVHRAVLAARSPVFTAMFSHDTLEANSGQVSIADMEGPVLRQLLAYMYTLQAPQLPNMAPLLLEAADKYGLSALKAACEQQVVVQLNTENAAASAVLGVRHSCPNLTAAAIAFIKANMQVMATQGWADAMLRQPQDLIEVSRLLVEPATETRMPATAGGGTTLGTQRQPHRDPGRQTPTTAAAPTAPRHTTQLDEAAVSRMRSLSAEEKNRKLIEAAKVGAVDELRALLAAGADVRARDATEYRNTALHWAADRGHVEAVRCLAESGLEVDVRNNLQRTPLHWAARNGHTAVIRVLTASSADPNGRGRNGWSPLHEAASKGHTEAVAALLEAGSNRAARNDQGKTPLDIARQKNQQRIMELLT